MTAVIPGIVCQVQMLWPCSLHVSGKYRHLPARHLTVVSKEVEG